eukprot:scaffold99047_cov55-Attheya_sp.AAC.2
MREREKGDPWPALQEARVTRSIMMAATCMGSPKVDGDAPTNSQTAEANTDVTSHQSVWL